MRNESSRLDELRKSNGKLSKMGTNLVDVNLVPVRFTFLPVFSLSRTTTNNASSTLDMQIFRPMHRVLLTLELGKMLPIL